MYSRFERSWEPPEIPLKGSTVTLRLHYISDTPVASRKLLLTATPLQNSLLELYGLSTLIDEHLFGDLNAFRSQYIANGGDADGLK
jgi:hypothetical protein